MYFLLTGHRFIVHSFGFSGIIVLRLCPTCTIVHPDYPRTSEVLAAIPFIAEFKLACDGGEVSTFLILIKREELFYPLPFWIHSSTF